MSSDQIIELIGKGIEVAGVIVIVFMAHLSQHSTTLMHIASIGTSRARYLAGTGVPDCW